MYLCLSSWSWLGHMSRLLSAVDIRRRRFMTIIYVINSILRIMTSITSMFHLPNNLRSYFYWALQAVLEINLFYFLLWLHNLLVIANTFKYSGIIFSWLLFVNYTLFKTNWSSLMLSFKKGRLSFSLDIQIRWMLCFYMLINDSSILLFQINSLTYD